MNTVLNTRVCREGAVGIVIQDLYTGRVLFEHNPDTPLQPASNQKILSTTAALGILTPEYRFKTAVHYTGELTNGVVTGDLFLVGGGDPFLVKEELWKVAERVNAMGIRRVAGNIITDGTFFDAVGYPDTDWNRISMPLWYNAPTGGVAYNFNAISVMASPGTRQGDPVRITVDPPMEFFNIQSTAVTGTPRSRITLVLDVRENDDSIDIIMRGSLPTGTATQTYYRHLTSSQAYAGNAFRYYLESFGVTVDGAVTQGVLPAATRRVYVHESRLLSELLIPLNKYSNNFMIEQIIKTIAAEQCNCPGSTAHGLQIVHDFFQNEWGINTSGMVLSDASGLSRRNRVTARQFADILRYTLVESFFGPEFMAGQPLAGTDGTMRRRLADHPQQRIVRAKTGLINNVVCLSGVIDGRRGKGLVFSILINRNRGRHGESRQAQDRMLEAMLDYWNEVNNQ
jgi:serine-type D-Ala-D-Ala carboxypeptidase/endopeptidase (penicillin-binding protein 4)